MFKFLFILTVCFKRAYTAPPKCTSFVGLLIPCKGPVQYMEEEDNRVAGRKRQRDESSVMSALLSLNKVRKEYEEAIGECTDSLADTAIQYVG